jgi:hypothetical protein
MKASTGGSLRLVALATMVGKGWRHSRLLRRAMRAANIEREIEPLIGFMPSLLLGAGGTIAAVALARALPLRPEHAGTLLVPGAIRLDVTGFHPAHWPRQGDLAGLRLPDPGERHLPVRPAAHPIDAVAGRGGHPAGCHGGASSSSASSWTASSARSTRSTPAN